MKRTPYYDFLEKKGGKFVDFAGFEMPVQFKSIIAEHKAVRENVGLFDVSHMGEFILSGKGAFDTIQNLLSNNFEKLQIGRVRYSLMLNEKGGVVDDILVYCINKERYLMVVNASNIEKDKIWVKAHLQPNTKFEDLSDNTVLLALQGPNAIKIIKKIVAFTDIPQRNYSFKIINGILDGELLLSRTGYTAEDGFELYCKTADASKMMDIVCEAGREYNLQFCGLGARDTLRLEGGMPLYGNEMNDETFANELGLNIFIKLTKSKFIGRDALIAHEPEKQRLGIELIDRGIAREHAPIYDGDKKIGVVTSGTHSPTLNKSIAMVRVDADFESETLEVEVRGKRLKAKVCPLPFYKRNK